MSNLSVMTKLFRHCIALVSIALVSLQAVTGRESPNCKVLPGDSSWPSETDWVSFNRSVDGRLIRTIPVATPCHNPTYDAEACDYVRSNWNNADFHLGSPSSVMDSIFANKSCDPFTSPDDQCVIGTYVQYAVNISSPAHIVKTLEFVKQHNIRFVVRNTGHDYIGRSTATGAVSVWMHNLQNTTWMKNFTSPSYKGPAVKVAAGVAGGRLTEEADGSGYTVVVGSCPTVGFAGGFIQGGGHSTMSSFYGMAADHALSFEVITTRGDFVTASPTENQDLFWALRGGGGGTYGIVWSVTVKALPDVPITLATVSFSSQGISNEAYKQALTAYQTHTLQYTDAGCSVLGLYNNLSFEIAPLFAPNLTSNQVSTLLEPFLNQLKSLGVSYNLSIESYTGYQKAIDGFNATFPVGDVQIGNRLLPQSLFTNNSKIQELMSIVWDIINVPGGIVWDLAISPSLAVAGFPDNAVSAAWRNAEREFGINILMNNNDTLETIAKRQYTISYTLGEQLTKLSPGAGSYDNEASYTEPDFKQAFFGDNYDRLLAIKDKWDPDQLLYGPISVGGDRWKETSEGRLCKTELNYH